MRHIKLEQLEELDYGREEAFKSLRTNLKFCGDQVKKILVTSCVAGEGKSTISFNLAKAFAEDERNVAYVDCDLRKSVMMGRLGIRETNGQEIYGLSHYLSGQVKLDEVMCETQIEGLYMILAGPEVPNPTELLGNMYFEHMLAQLTEQMDYVILDAPPLGAVIDAAILATGCDGAILVIENNKISYRLALKVKQQLMKTGCRILGSVLNKVNLNKSYYRKYYRDYYNDYYGS